MKTIIAALLIFGTCFLQASAAYAAEDIKATSTLEGTPVDVNQPAEAVDSSAQEEDTPAAIADAQVASSSASMPAAEVGGSDDSSTTTPEAQNSPAASESENAAEDSAIVVATSTETIAEPLVRVLGNPAEFSRGAALRAPEKGSRSKVRPLPAPPRIEALIIAELEFDADANPILPLIATTTEPSVEEEATTSDFVPAADIPPTREADGATTTLPADEAEQGTTTPPNIELEAEATTTSEEASTTLPADEQDAPTTMTSDASAAILKSEDDSSATTSSGREIPV
jgi:hypothetical protein